MDDFDNDGLLDVVVTSFPPNESMSYHRNRGDGTFEDRTVQAGVSGQLGGMLCYQADYDNDGLMDVFVLRGAWMPYPIRPSLLRNTVAGVFVDVTSEAGLLDPVNSNAAAWSDYDNDGLADLFIGCERQTNRLYRNKGNGTFEQVAEMAGVQGNTGDFCKGCTWIDHDNDGYPDLFLNNAVTGRLLHNNRDGTFTDLSPSLGIDGPDSGFSCWTWDYDNDGWQDVFATCFDRTLADVVKGILGQPHQRFSNRLYRNVNGKGFENVTERAGLDMVFACMGSNFGDFDNDGLLDMYLGTGEPEPGHARPQPHVQERQRRAVRRDHGRLAAPATFRKGTASPAATGTAMAMSIFSSRPVVPPTAIGTTIFCFKTPARGTTG